MASAITPPQQTNDVHEGKWLVSAVSRKPAESPEECVIREKLAGLFPPSATIEWAYVFRYAWPTTMSTRLSRRHFEGAKSLTLQ